MSETWALRIRAADAATCARVRCTPGIEVCRQQDNVWLRGAAAGEESGELEQVLRTLPAARYRVAADGQLTLAGRRTPLGYLPEGPWQPLQRWLQVGIDPAAMAAEVDHKVAIQLVRCAEPRETNVALTTRTAWTRYAIAAPQVRLDRWAFAVSDNRSVVVWGAPPPPIPSTAFCETEGVAVQAGWHWSPLVDAAVLRELLQLESGDLALLCADGSRHHIRNDQFVRATRSAVRLSAREDGG